MNTPSQTISAWTSGWWEEAFRKTLNPSERSGHPRGSLDMLAIIAYDITDPKRLKNVADCCKDFGIRVQYSVFECYLEADQLEAFWTKLCAIAEPSEDRLVVYPIYGQALRSIRTYGQMQCAEVVISYQY